MVYTQGLGPCGLKSRGGSSPFARTFMANPERSHVSELLATKKVLVFDFDGVILRSDDIRAAGVRNLFSDFPDQQDAIFGYYNDHRGINRLLFFEGVYRDVLHLPYDEKIGVTLGKRYSDEIIERVIRDADLIPGALEFLAMRGAPRFLATSGPANDVARLLSAFKLSEYFAKIYTYPFSKADAIRDVQATLGLDLDQIAFFGDAMADFNAARDAEVDFIAVTKTPSLFAPGTNNIQDFTELT